MNFDIKQILTADTDWEIVGIQMGLVQNNSKDIYDKASNIHCWGMVWGL